MDTKGIERWYIRKNIHVDTSKYLNQFSQGTSPVMNKWKKEVRANAGFQDFTFIGHIYFISQFAYLKQWDTFKKGDNARDWISSSI